MVDSDLLFGKNIIIYSDPTNFTLHKGENSNGVYISVNKDNAKVKRVADYTPKLGSGVQVYSILGILHGITNFYMLGVNRATYMGNILNSRIFKVDEVVYLSNVSNDANNIIAEDDVKYIEMIKEFLKRNTLYFSDTMDLTLSIEKTFTKKTQKNVDSFIFPTIAPHFCWNFNMTRSLDCSELIGFIHPVINGYVGIRTVSDYSQEFNYIIISRKDNRRSGMRFLVRGNDKNGFSANFAESEQIIVERNRSDSGKINLMSYLQIRGSIPLLWTQMPNLQLNPTIVPRNDYSENFSTFKKHISDLVAAYGKNVLVNLIDRKGSQKIIGEYFLNLSKDLKENKSKIILNYSFLANPNKEIDYVWFDFHHECKGMKYQNLSKLLKGSSVSQALNGFDFFHVVINNSALVNQSNDSYLILSKEDVNVINTQKGVFRTNCVDCLDRTNVVQTVFSRQILHKMLHKMNLCDGPSGEAFQEFNPVFESSFKVLWADHGDHLSLAYSGTGALKSDFVRTGKRTKKGALQDGINTCKRFYINNFCDGYNQDCHDYFLGNLNPKKEPFKEHSTKIVKILTPAAFLLVFALYYFLINIALPKEYEENFSKKLLRVLIFMGVFYLTFKTTFNTLKKTIINTSTVDHF